MTELPEQFYGNEPWAIWDEGYTAALNGRSRDTNPFLTGEAKRAYQLGQWAQQHPGEPLPDLPLDPAYGTYEPDEDT